MTDSTQQQLRRAYELIKAKKRNEAVQILLPILQTDRDNANAWWLLANAVTDPKDAREALENVLRLRPDHENARKLLDKLNATHPQEPKPEPEPEQETFDFGGVGAEETPPQAAADPFGGQAETFGAPASSTPAGGAAADPFGAPTASGPAARGASSTAATDPFGGGAARPAGAPAAAAPRAKKSGTNPLVIILAVVGIVALCGCVACFAVTSVLPTLGLSILGTSADEVVGVLEDFSATVESSGFQETLQAGGGSILPGVGSALPADIVRRGSINYGESRRDTLQVGQKHGWVFSGNQGDTVVIEMVGVGGSSIDPYLVLYGPDNAQIANDDDGGDGLNSRLEFTLPTSGTYTIMAWTFAGTGGGEYELRLNRR